MLNTQIRGLHKYNSVTESLRKQDKRKSIRLSLRNVYSYRNWVKEKINDKFKDKHNVFVSTVLEIRAKPLRSFES